MDRHREVGLAALEPGLEIDGALEAGGDAGHAAQPLERDAGDHQLTGGAVGPGQGRAGVEGEAAAAGVAAQAAHRHPVAGHGHPAAAAGDLQALGHDVVRGDADLAVGLLQITDGDDGADAAAHVAHPIVGGDGDVVAAAVAATGGEHHVGNHGGAAAHPGGVQGHGAAGAPGDVADVEAHRHRADAQIVAAEAAAVDGAADLEARRARLEAAADREVGIERAGDGDAALGCLIEAAGPRLHRAVGQHQGLALDGEAAGGPDLGVAGGVGLEDDATAAAVEGDAAGDPIEAQHVDAAATAEADGAAHAAEAGLLAVVDQRHHRGGVEVGRRHRRRDRRR